MLELQQPALLLGHTGFVGSTLARCAKFDKMYSRSDGWNDFVEHGVDQEWGTVVVACVPAVKWMANKDPAADKSVIQDLVKLISRLKARQVVLISTIDVYNIMDGTADEDVRLPKSAEHHAYGTHRMQFEEQLSGAFGEKLVTVRLPALFGVGLKKNAVFDLIYGKPTNGLDPRTSFQWLNMSRLGEYLSTILGQSDAHLVNLFPEPIETADILAHCFPQAVVKQGTSGTPLKYNVRTKYGKSLWGSSVDGYIASAQSVLEELVEFVRFTRAARDSGGVGIGERGITGQLTVSNIAWNHPDDTDKILADLSAQGVYQIEVAPSKVWPLWGDPCWEAGAQSQFLASLIRSSFRVSSFQALTYAQEDAALFDKAEEGRQALESHLAKVYAMAGRLGAQRLVFGSPKQRLVPDEMSANEADAIAIDFFSRQAVAASAHGTVLCLEMNPTDYGCNWVTNVDHAVRIVRAVNHPGFRLHLDSACMHLAGDDVVKAVSNNLDIIGHVHVSEPFLGDFSNPKVDHERFAWALRTCGYSGHISLEMRSPGNVAEAVEFVCETYF